MVISENFLWSLFVFNYLLASTSFSYVILRSYHLLLNYW